MILGREPLRTDHIVPFPATRHYQRYEYVSQRGWIVDKTVADVGCGNATGTYILAATAKHVTGIDPFLAPYLKVGGFRPALFAKDQEGMLQDKTSLWGKDIFDVHDKFDVAVSIECFEHQAEPIKFVEHIGTLTNELFLTTPLASVTGPTINPEHVAEYSTADFIDILNKGGWDVLELLFQSGDMKISNYGRFTGNSWNSWHTVQMAWCRKKGVV